VEARNFEGRRQDRVIIAGLYLRGLLVELPRMMINFRSKVEIPVL
jgi:hypothetical protein